MKLVNSSIPTCYCCHVRDTDPYAVGAGIGSDRRQPRAVRQDHAGIVLGDLILLLAHVLLQDLALVAAEFATSGLRPGVVAEREREEAEGGDGKFLALGSEVVTDEEEGLCEPLFDELLG